jgi:hypothetical protein
MKTLFQSLTEQPHRTEAGLFDYIHLSLGRLLSLASPDWNGDLDGFQVPTSWKQLQSVYKGLGMGETQKCRLCTGNKNAVHSPIVMKPHDEDHTELKLGCVCVPKRLIKHGWDCPICCQKCPMCFTMRKDVLSFEYMPLTSIITNMCLSQMLCHDFLALWRNRNAWRGCQKILCQTLLRNFEMVRSLDNTNHFGILCHIGRFLLFAQMTVANVHSEHSLKL